MEIKVLASHQNSLVIQRNILAGICAFTLLGNLIFSICLLRQERQIVLIPPDLRNEVSISNKRVSPKYLEEMSIFFLSKLLDLTSKNIAYKSEVILRHIHPSSYAKINEHLRLEKKRYKEFNLSTHFVISEFKINEKNLTVEATGTLISNYGNAGKSEETVIYSLEYSYAHGLLMIKNFGIVHEKKTQENSGSTTKDDANDQNNKASEINDEDMSDE